MDCSWDVALLGHGANLPAELLQIIDDAGGSDASQYLEVVTRLAQDARYTDLLFAYCEKTFAHICASPLATIATLGRVVPFAPYLAPYATQLLASELPRSSQIHEEQIQYLLALLRLLRCDHRTFKQHVDLLQVESLLYSSSRPVVYLAIRIMQICFAGADHWFEEMVKKYLGEDTPEDDINGPWDDKTIDYRFLTLWEEQRCKRMKRMIEFAQSAMERSTKQQSRVIPGSCFHPSTALVGGMLLPRVTSSREYEDDLVATATIEANLKSIATALKSPESLLLTGLAGSGKTLLVRHIARKLGKLDKMVTLHLNEQSDAKLLIGIYTTGDTPGSFMWKPGVLTTAVQEGRWVLVEDLDRAPNEIIGTLLPLIERRELLIPSQKQTIHAAQGFRIVATVRSTINHRGEETRPLAHMLGARHWQSVSIAMPSTSEQQQIALQLFPSLAQLLPQFMAVYERLQASRQRAVSIGQSKTGVLRAISPRDLLKWCQRVTKLLQQRNTFSSTDMDDILMEAIDCFVGALPDGEARSGMAAVIAEQLRIDPQRRDYLLSERDVKYNVDKARITIGRYSLPRALQQKASQGTFSTNPHTNRMLERVAAAVVNREPLLLVGETGVGKTTAVQHLARHLGKKLEPFNLSQQSEAGDLLGGFKPVTARSLMVPMKDEFDELFRASFSMTKNQQFLELLGKQMAKSNWKAVCKLWQQALRMVDQQRPASPSREGEGEAPSKKRKVESRKVPDFARWDTFAAKVVDVQRKVSAGSEAFAFSFVEGNIVKAVRNGDWVLLDEINLASPDTLESVIDLLDPSAPSLSLTEAGNIERIEAHPEFRVFAAMNPATDVGKRDLPPGIRSRFTELYVESPDKDIKSLQSIVRSYLRTEAAADPAIALDVSTLYQQIIGLAEQNKLVDGAGQKPHFSLRTLTRTLSFAKYIAPQCSLRRAVYEGFQMSFLTFLDTESVRLVQPLLEQHLLGKRINIQAELQKALRKPEDGHQYVQGWPGSKHWVRRGREKLQEQAHYILTPFIRSNLEKLVRAASTRQFPVLIQGPTSSGKTSMIDYLAKRTGHKFMRINNHEHTDLQEYLGTYVSGTDGRLQFQEGILVRALREGHWIVLDELNLAPTDVLEALNRLLDDNRELLNPETQETVQPHENFMLFATQNPAGLYGGRKTLSRAFRNRFLELHFDDIPVDELQEILHQRTQLPESRCKRIVTVYRELSVLRQENRLFEQKSFATLRDLFRWALRANDTIEQLAANGFMLLAERVRKPEERQALKDIIERVLSKSGPRVCIDEVALYAQSSPEIARYNGNATHQAVVWTKAMRRLYVLVSRAIEHNEPVLLVGETGCGKTTVCQMLSEALRMPLHTVNAHQNTETGDLIGSQRPLRNRVGIENLLRRRLLASSLLQGLGMATAHSMDAQGVEIDAATSTDALLEAYDQAVAALSPPERRSAYCASQAHSEIQLERTRFRALFEWVDGSLVQAMKDQNGAFFLLDEISLADDSVLERINSVLEPQRSILLAEKGSLDSFVTASPDFQFFATMNPGGDYGKRELSPALRNRFTEIWVPALSETADIVQIVSAKLAPSAKHYATAQVAFAQWFKERYNTSASSSISVRDALAWVDFVNAFAEVDVIAAVVHGAALVYIDTLGANPAGFMTMTGHSLKEERTGCLLELSRLVGVDASAVYSASVEVTKNAAFLRIGPFSISSRTDTQHLPQAFTFDAKTTRKNAMRVVRAMQLPKPVMLEGSPGVGKTALVTAIAAAAGAPLTRINLSEQTDLLDLFGSDAPVEGAATGTFAWRDAPFLRAMKNGEWVLLDEMNLASQSVLEGLNACLDHRGEVYVPELGQTFSRHPDFKLFAAQNPHHQGGGRKGLPASFVNRFTVVYADAFTPDDLMLICQTSFPHIGMATLQLAIAFIDRLDVDVVQRRRFGTNGGPWEFNLRDISRWLALMSSDNGMLKAGNARDFVRLLFAQRFRSSSDRDSVRELVASVFTESPPASDLFSSVSPLTLQLGLALLPRHHIQSSPIDRLRLPDGSHEYLRILESVMLCVQQRWPVVLTGTSGAGKTTMIERLASALGVPLTTISMNAETDAMDLIGGYEQADPLRQGLQALSALTIRLATMAKTGLLGDESTQAVKLLAALQQQSASSLPTAESFHHIVGSLEGLQAPELDDLVATLQRCMVAIEKARFEWTDGLLVDALQQGRWLVLDNANLCSSSVLDRLNSVLEPDGMLIINEHTEQDGAPRIIQPHPDFRIFLLVDPRYGELSRAMRNRAVELYLPVAETHPISAQPLFAESAMARFEQLYPVRNEENNQYLSVLHDHAGLRDQPLLSRWHQQLTAGLSDEDVDHLDIVNSCAPVEPPKGLSSFYETVASRGQASADYASVQTVHPLNNQALVQQNQQTFAQASTLALMRDVNVQLSPLREQLSSFKTNPAVMRQLERVRRSQQASRNSEMIHQIDAIAQLILQSIQQMGPVSLPELVGMSPPVLRLCGYLVYFGFAVNTGVLDQPLFAAWLSAFRYASRQAPVASTALAPLLQEVQQTLAALSAPKDEVTGRACTILWRRLKPNTPATIAQLNASLKLEQLIDRFDVVCGRFEQPLTTFIGLRLAFLRSLATVSVSASDMDELVLKLEGFMSVHELEDIEEPATRRPHFAKVFETLCRQFAALNMESQCLAPEDAAGLELLAMRQTKSNASIVATESGSSSAQSDLRLLGSVLHKGRSEDQPSPVNAIAGQLFDSMGSVAEVSLNDMDILTCETKTLGRLFGLKAHLLSKSKSNALDACLQRLLTVVLRALTSQSDDTTLQSLATSLEAELRGDYELAISGAIERPHSGAQTKPGRTVIWVHNQLHSVIEYLRRPKTEQQSRLVHAAHAWTSFALVCLALYVPDETFDPALQPRLQRDVHRQTVSYLSQQLQSVRTLRATMYGDEDSLRARVLRESLQNLGPEPDVEEVCRPGMSELSQMEGELVSLMRTVHQLHNGYSAHLPTVPDDNSMSNILRVRDRLQHKYRAYADITSPVIGFIDCLRTSQVMKSLADTEVQQTGSWNLIDPITPFVNASVQTWLSDEPFVTALSGGIDQQQTLYVLSILASRCSVWSLTKASIALRQAVDDTFIRFYTHWKVRLSDDQRREAAKSSLYRFKGDEDLQDGLSTEALEELFPGQEPLSIDTSDQLPLKKQQEDNSAHKISQLYHAILAPSKLDQASFWDILQRFAGLAASTRISHRDEPYITAMICSLYENNEKLAHGNARYHPYNMYTDPNVEQVKMVVVTLAKVQGRFRSLHQSWPEHATPVDVLRLCAQTLDISHTEPLTKFLPLLEKLHMTVGEWQDIASREFSVSEVLEDVMTLIVSWRQLELSSWAGLLNREAAACEQAASSWWYVAYENIIAASRGLEDSSTALKRHGEDLLQTLGVFIASCGFGEFTPRLRMLRDFEAYLAAYSTEEPSLAFVRQALSNFVEYHAHFQPIIVDRLNKGRAGLEKDVKNVIQVASWKDRSIETMKQSAKSSHKKLLKIVRKYRLLLAQPVAPILQATIQQKHLADTLADAPALQAFEGAVVEETTRRALPHLTAWSNRPDRFKNIPATVSLMQLKIESAERAIDTSGRVEEFVSDLIAAITELQNATPATLTEDNKAAVQHLKTRKRRLLADVLRDVRFMGFQSNLSEDVLAQQATIHQVLAHIPVLDGEREREMVNTADADYSLHRLLHIMPSVREGARKHSEDLTPAEAARCLSLLESMLQVAVKQRTSLCQHLRDTARLHSTLQYFRAFASQLAPVVSSSHHYQHLDSRIECFGVAAETCMRLVKTQSELGGGDYAIVLQRLQEAVDQVAKLTTDLGSMPQLPAGIANCDIQGLQGRFNHVVTNLATLPADAAQQYPELEPTLSQLLKWSHNDMGALQSSKANGNVIEGPNEWVHGLLGALDHVLGAIQGLGQATTRPLSDCDEKAWLVQQGSELSRTLAALRADQTCGSLELLLRALPHLIDADQSLAVIAAACRLVQPVLVTFTLAYHSLLRKLCALHTETNKMAFQLATSFLQLTAQGFCSPSEKAEGESQKPGDIESGTGLGEGEGAEDISKDVGDDEDLSELAQEAGTRGEKGEMEDEKDAVDMADEEMEGELGDQAEGSQDESGDGNETAEADGMDEEAGDVDDLGPATVDEKMWDEGKDEEQTDRTAEDGKGTKDDQELGAGKDQQQDEKTLGQDGNEGDELEAEAGTEEAESVEQQGAETLDPHVQDQQNLDLPDDADMDGQKAVEDDSDFDTFSDMEDEQRTPTEDVSEAIQDSEVEKPQEDVTDEATEGAIDDDKDADETTAEEQQEEARSDIMMQQEQDEGGDERADETVFGEAGTGADEKQAETSRSQAAASIQENEDTEGGSEQQQKSEAGASGQERGIKTQDANASSEQGLQEQSRLPYKQIGDVLEEWYRQHRQIESARQHEDTDANHSEDVDMADASFEHLPDEQTAADTQALGAASAEQSTAMDEESGLLVNDQLESNLPPLDENPEEQQEQDQQLEEHTQVEPSDSLQPQDKSNAFIGEPARGDVHVEMADEQMAADEDHVRDVDQQLSNTHLEHEEDDDETSLEDARTLWSDHEASTRNLALILTEHLRLILQPTQATKMRGDFRTGKRLNIKRIIPYIASSYKRDKIWMRRSVPSKRSYQIMLAIDDSKSMAESDSRGLAFETLALVAKSMSMLDVGELSVVGFGEDVDVAHDFSTPFTSEAGAEVFKHFTFAQRKTNVRKLLAESIELFRTARLKAAGSVSELWQLQLIISDGICEDHPAIRQLVRQAHEERIMVVFVVVDAAAQKAEAAGGPKQSILELQTAEFGKNAAGEMEVKMVKYLDTFPFKYYLIVRDVQELPGVLAGALRQWFAEVVETGG